MHGVLFFLKGDKKVNKGFWDKTGYVATDLEMAVYYLTTLTDLNVIFQMTTRKTCDGRVLYLFATNANTYMNDILVNDHGFSEGYRMNFTSNSEGLVYS